VEMISTSSRSSATSLSGSMAGAPRYPVRCRSVKYATRGMQSLPAQRGGWRAKRAGWGVLAADALDLGAAAAELVLEALEAAVEVIDAVDHGLALGRERGDDERNRRAQGGRHHGRALEALDAFDGRGLALDMDARAEPRQLLHVHEAAFENGLGDARGAARARHQRHQLRLQVGGETRKRLGRDFDRFEPGTVAAH